MSNYKSKEFVPSDSSSDEDENVKPKVKTPEASPVKEKKQKKEKKSKKNKDEVRLYHINYDINYVFQAEIFV